MLEIYSGLRFFWGNSVNNFAQIQVQDTGKGIKPEFLPYVFEYFRQEDGATTRKFGGLGLGLAIVRHLVELHGGTVQADSLGENLGATFTVQLPLMPTQPSINPDSQLPEQAVNLGELQVLVVDDETDTRNFTTFLLQQVGATVITAASATEALTALRRSPGDILICVLECRKLTVIRCCGRLEPYHQNREAQLKRSPLQPTLAS